MIKSEDVRALGNIAFDTIQEVHEDLEFVMFTPLSQFNDDRAKLKKGVRTYQWRGFFDGSVSEYEETTTRVTPLAVEFKFRGQKYAMALPTKKIYDRKLIQTSNGFGYQRWEDTYNLNLDAVLSVASIGIACFIANNFGPDPQKVEVPEFEVDSTKSPGDIPTMPDIDYE